MLIYLYKKCDNGIDSNFEKVNSVHYNVNMLSKIKTITAINSQEQLDTLLNYKHNEYKFDNLDKIKELIKEDGVVFINMKRGYMRDDEKLCYEYELIDLDNALIDLKYSNDCLTIINEDYFNKEQIDIMVKDFYNEFEQVIKPTEKKKSFIQKLFRK